MATKIMAEVWEHSQAKGSELLLLLALADHADTVHAQCWPSVRRLAFMIRMSERNTRYLLRRLEKDGHIAIQIKGSARKTNLYRILRPWCMGQQLLQENICTPETPCPSDGAKAFAPDPKSEPKPEEKENARAREEEQPDVTKDFLLKLGLTPGGEAWEAALNGNGHHQDG